MIKFEKPKKTELCASFGMCTVCVRFVSMQLKSNFFFFRLQNSEECPHCHSIGQRSMLRFFFVNFDEAIYKCSNGSCMYPFENYKFKNVKDNTLYMYEPIEVDLQPITTATISAGPSSTEWHDTFQQNDNVNAAFLAKTFTPSQNNENIEEFDFDFGFLENIANDEPLKFHTTTTTTASMNDTIGQPDDVDIDDFLDNLIHGKSDTKFTDTDTMVSTVPLENNNQISFGQFNFVEPRVLSSPLPPLPPSPAPSALPSLSYPSASPIIVEKKELEPWAASAQLPKAKRKLSKCLKSIAMKTEKKEKKPKRTKNPVGAKKAIEFKMEENPLQFFDSTKLGEVTKVYSRNMVSTKKLPSFESATNGMDVDKKLLSLVQQQDIQKPLDLLQQLKKLDMKKANAPLVRKIIAKSNAVPATPPLKSEPNVSDVVTPVKEEPPAKPAVPNVTAERGDAVQNPNYPSFGFARRMPTSNGLPDLASSLGYDNFGSISYEPDEELFGQPLEIDQIVEEELEIIPIEVGEDDSMFEIEAETISNVGDLDLFGCSSFATVVEATVVADTNALAHNNFSPIVATTEVAEVKTSATAAPKKIRKPYKRKEKVTATDSQTTVFAVVPIRKPQVKRPRKKKIETLENCDGNIVANTAIENATVALPKPKAARKPRKPKAVVSKEISDENLAGFSLNELNESVANAAQKTAKKPRKRNVKATASETAIDAPSTNVINPEAIVAAKAVKKPRKKKIPSDKVTIIATGDTTAALDAPKAARKTVKRPRKNAKVTHVASTESCASQTSADVTTESDSAVCVAKPKARKKKISMAETPVSSDGIESQQSTIPMKPKKPPNPPKKPRKRKIADTLDVDTPAESPTPANKKPCETATVSATETACETSMAAATDSTIYDTKSI